MNCDVGEATEGLEMSNDVGKRRKGWRISCDVGEVAERSLLFLQSFRSFNYVTVQIGLY